MVRITLLTLLSFTILISIFFFLSVLMVAKPEKTLKTWQEDPEKFEMSAFKTTISRLELSIQLNESNLKAHLTLAKFYEIAAMHENNNIKYLKLAEKHYTNSISLSPNSSIGWLYLASLYSQVGKHAKAIKTLNVALALSPYERQSQVQAIPLIAKYWGVSHENESLNNETRKKIITHIIKYDKNLPLLKESLEKHEKLAELEEFENKFSN